MGCPLGSLFIIITPREQPLGAIFMVLAPNFPELCDECQAPFFLTGPASNICLQ